MIKVNSNYILPGISVLVLVVVMLLPDPGGIRQYTSKKEYADIMSNLQQGLVDKGYEIEKIQPIDKGLGKAGLKIRTYRVIFFNPKHTMNAVQEKYPAFSALLPLSITVAREKNRLRIVGTPFRMLIKNAEGKDLKALVRRWQQDSEKVIKKALKNSEAPFRRNDESLQQGSVRLAQRVGVF